MRTRILDPLKMKDTFFFPSAASAEQRNRIADVDRRWPLPPAVTDYDKLRPGWKYVAPEGGLYSTAEDLLTFLRVFRHQGQIPGYPRILSTNSVRLLVTDQVGDVSFGCAGKIGRSLGFFIVRTGCDQVPGSSPGTIMHNGAFATDFWFDSQKDEIAMFLYQVPTNKETPWVKEATTFRKLLANIDAAPAR